MAEPFSTSRGRRLFGADRGLVFVVSLLLIWIDLLPSAVAAGGMKLNAAGQENAQVRTLEPGKPIERELAGGQSHPYRITLAAGQYLKLVIDQRGIDVAVRFVWPDGRPPSTFDTESRPDQPETIAVLVEVTGDYQLTVHPVQKEAAAGRYEIRIEELRAATEDDRALQEARRLYREWSRQMQAGKYDQALPPIERALEIRQRILGPEHPDVASVVSALALLYWRWGDYAKPGPLFQRALEIHEKALGPEHPLVALSLINLGSFYWNKGEYARAESLLLRAIDIQKKVLGPAPPKLAAALIALSNLYCERGEYGKAEPLLLQSLEIQEKASGPEHPDVVISLINLAILYQERGEYGKAEPLLLRALSIREKALGPKHPDVARVLNTMANLYREREEYGKAEPLLLRALSIREEALGAKHPDIAASLIDLARLYRDQGESERMEPLLLRALEIWKEKLGPAHPRVAESLQTLANLYRDRGDEARAEPLYRQALEIFEKALGAENPSVAKVLNDLAVLQTAKGDIANAVALQVRANAISERNLTLNLASGSERQKLAYLALYTKETEFTLSFHSLTAPDNPQALDLAFTTLLRRKARGLEAMADVIGTLRRRAAPQDRELFDRLVETRSQLAMSTLRDSDEGRPATDQIQLELLEKKVEELEAELSARSIEFRTQTQPVTIAAVQQALPAGSALVEFAVYTPRELPIGKSLSPRYLVYLLAAQGPPKWVDLGEASSIDRIVDAWRKALRDPGRFDIKQLGRTVDARIMQPVRSLLNKMPGDTHQLLIAPDGSLNLVPFAALVDEQNRYLIKRYVISYLTSGRDLLRSRTSPPSRTAPLIMADPAFGKGPPSDSDNDYKSGNAPANPQRPQRKRKQSDPPRIFFPPLPGTKDEALAIKAVLPEASLLMQEQATESALKQAEAPRILHIATHGFFFRDRKQRSTRTPVQMRARTARTGKLDDDPSRLSGLRLTIWAAQIEDPLLRSGLALAGANQGRSGNDDGVLTALEAAGLDLWGTKLVVLSACDTGVGEVRNGEGVQGLRRALVLAGSESQVMSLWPVLDQSVKELMVPYYQALQRGEGRSEGLRRVQLRLLRTADMRHPFYWASFIQSGEWASLKDRSNHID